MILHIPCDSGLWAHLQQSHGPWIVKELLLTVLYLLLQRAPEGLYFTSISQRRKFSITHLRLYTERCHRQKASSSYWLDSWILNHRPKCVYIKWVWGDKTSLLYPRELYPKAQGIGILEWVYCETSQLPYNYVPWKHPEATPFTQTLRNTLVGLHHTLEDLHVVIFSRPGMTMVSNWVPWIQ